jgi:hypothetical protein
MNSTRLAAACMTLAIPFIAGCSYFDTREEFVIRVQSIDAPETTKATDPLTVRFYGSIGANSCYQLHDVRSDRTQNSLNITFIGKVLQSRGSACMDQLALLEHAVTVQPPLKNPFVITVHQPDGTTLTRSVTVQ